MRKKPKQQAPVAVLPPAQQEKKILPIQIPTSKGEASHEQVCLRAYLLWEAAGKPANKDVEFWLEAERELLSR